MLELRAVQLKCFGKAYMLNVDNKMDKVVISLTTFFTQKFCPPQII